MEERNFSFRCIAYKEKDGTFTGVCLDLDIVEEGHATLEEAILSINDAISSHIQAAAKLGFPRELVSRPAPKSYWEKLDNVIHKRSSKPTFEPFQFFTTPRLSSLGYV